MTASTDKRKRKALDYLKGRGFQAEYLEDGTCIITGPYPNHRNLIVKTYGLIHLENFIEGFQFSRIFYEIEKDPREDHKWM